MLIFAGPEDSEEVMDLQEFEEDPGLVSDAESAIRNSLTPEL